MDNSNKNFIGIIEKCMKNVWDINDLVMEGKIDAGSINEISADTIFALREIAKELHIESDLSEEIRKRW